MAQPEARLVKKIATAVGKEGGRPIKIHGGDNPFQEVGISDLLICYQGRFIAMEVKQPGEDATVKQYAFLRSIERAGGTGGVVHSVEEALRLLRKSKRKR